MRGWTMAAAMLLAVPAIAEEPGLEPGTTAICRVARPADGDLKAFAARYFPTAGKPEIDRLIACLGDPHPAVRDEFAFTLWSEGLRGKRLSPDLMRYTGQKLSTILAAPEDAAGFRKPFAALVLSEIARADRFAPFMTDAELHALADTGTAYLRNVRDYRGFFAGEGWRHGVAHGADVMLQLALNPRLSRADADLMLGAVAMQVVPASSHYYIHGEPARLARPILFLAKRDDIDDAAWAAWFQALHPDDTPRSVDGYLDRLAAVHNRTAFANEIYVAAAESQDPQIRRLAPLAAGLLKARP